MTSHPGLVAVLVAAVAGCSSPAKSPANSAREDAAERHRDLDDLEHATSVLREFDFIHASTRARARCVAVLPSTVRGGLLVSAHRGHGVVACRTGGGWSGPAFVTLTGGGAGPQVGIESADLVMLFTTERSVSQLYRSSFALGADAS